MFPKNGRSGSANLNQPEHLGFAVIFMGMTSTRVAALYRKPWQDVDARFQTGHW